MSFRIPDMHHLNSIFQKQKTGGLILIYSIVPLHCYSSSRKGLKMGVDFKDDFQLPMGYKDALV